MPSHAERLRLRWTERWLAAVAPELGRQLVNGRPPRPRSWPVRRWLAVTAADLDPEAGVGVIRLTTRPRSARRTDHTLFYERCRDGWRRVGHDTGPGTPAPVRRAAGEGGQVGMLEPAGSSGYAGYADRERHPGVWVQADTFTAAAQVGRVRVGGRTVPVPASGVLLVVWTSRCTTLGGVRPHIVALGADGSPLAELGPHDRLDSRAWSEIQQASLR